MRNLIDRMTPLGDPMFGIRDGHSCHSLRKDVKRGKVLLAFTCGLWELDDFDALVNYMKMFSKRSDREFAGALLRPHSMPFAGMLKMGKPVGDILEVAKDAGREFVQDGKIAAETLQTIGRPVMPLEAFVEVANRKWREAIDAGRTPFAWKQAPILREGGVPCASFVSSCSTSPKPRLGASGDRFVRTMPVARRRATHGR